MVTSLRMTPGSRRACIVLGIALGLCGAVPHAAGQGNAAFTAVPAALSVRFTTSNELSEISQRALINEAQSIWRDAHVELRWIRDNRTDTDRPLRIVVARREVSPTEHQWPVAELLRFEDRSAIALASITAALRIVEERPELPLVDLPSMRQYQLGVVLGRAVAHEIGHYLLQSNAHSPYGLMRASIDAREFADLRTGGFRLDRESQAWLAAIRTARNN
jgi:hypothetical protein